MNYRTLSYRIVSLIRRVNVGPNRLKFTNLAQTFQERVGTWYSTGPLCITDTSNLGRTGTTTVNRRV